MSQYELRVSNLRSSTIRLAITGEMDLAAVPTVIDAILGAALANPTYEVHLDLHEVSFVELRGVDALIEVAHRLDDNGVRLVIAGASPEVQQALEAAGPAVAVNLRTPSREPAQPSVSA